MIRLTDEMVHAAAMAIREVVCNRSGRAKDWNEIPSQLKWSYREEARAALIAADQEASR